MALIAVAAAGTAIQVYGQMQAANARSAAANDEANAKRLMAQEVQDRMNLNRETLRKQGDTMIGNQRSQYAAGNVDVGSGSPLLTMENTFAETKRKINDQQIEADFRSRMDIIGAASDERLASQYQQSGQIGMVGTLLTRGAAIYGAMSTPNGSPAPGGNSGLGVSPDESVWGSANASESFGWMGA